jgi:hypothetical protein
MNITTSEIRLVRENSNTRVRLNVALDQLIEYLLQTADECDTSEVSYPTSKNIDERLESPTRMTSVIDA